ncbi:hypothetical protein K445DRAFT_186164 [Daldinia sp. EC12]|nr:hypothetical protein K445DRAFT_186164 [Daldinia sp. EC12]
MQEKGSLVSLFLLAYSSYSFSFYFIRVYTCRNVNFVNFVNFVNLYGIRLLTKKGETLFLINRPCPTNLPSCLACPECPGMLSNAQQDLVTRSHVVAKEPGRGSGGSAC